MVITELLSALDRLGIRLEVKEGRLLTHGPKGSLTPELGAALTEHKAVFIAVLGLAVLPDFAHFPRPIAALVRAAASGNLSSSPVTVPGYGLIPNLADNALAWAALYATGGDTKHHLECLWAACRGWEVVRRQ